MRHYAGIVLALLAIVAGAMITGCSDILNIDSDNDVSNTGAYQTQDRTYNAAPTNAVPAGVTP